jgi:hypothetical protein
MKVLLLHVVIFLGYFKLGELFGHSAYWLYKKVLDKR